MWLDLNVVVVGLEYGIPSLFLWGLSIVGVSVDILVISTPSKSTSQ
jgi:hypothetical protein